MLQQIGGFIGMALADIVNLFRGRQVVPCLVDWPEDDKREERYTILFGPANTSSAPTVAELNAMQEAKGLTAAGFNFAGTLHPDTTAGIKERAEWDNDRYPELPYRDYAHLRSPHRDNPDTVRMLTDPTDDCCPDYEVDCCLETDTIGEAQGKA